MKLSVAFIFLTGICNLLQAQVRYTDIAHKLILSANRKNQEIQFTMSDPRRLEWRRTPGTRNGMALYQMDIEQKKLLHELMYLTLSTSGYNKVTHLLFNEDLSAQFDPNTGQNKYWFAIYGEPSEQATWGWRLEGHHVSINFTLEGNKLTGVTPFELGAYPLIIESDTVRAGFRSISKEIDLGFELINSLDSKQREKAVLSAVKPDEVLMGEGNLLPKKQPVGIAVKELTPGQQTIVKKLVREYLDNVNTELRIDHMSLHFAWWGPVDNSGKYRYRLHSPELLIDFDNIGNHVHCLWRVLKKDFGNNPFGN